MTTVSKVTVELGLVKGETCNRNGCAGIIDEHEKEGSCSCHINPPCGYCTTDTAYCPECNWCPDDDDVVPVDPEVEKRNRESYAEQMKKWDEQKESFYRKFHGKEPATKLEMRQEGHTHFSQKVIGVFPPNCETRESLYPKVKGTFGGRWEYFSAEAGKFSFIAYTD
jgi:hypothetical protein